ncbi:MAG TPA: class I tRNA ligase family protein, partial [Bryobacterales bacterium]|nr:class I tRNA ligase family protein [Bryobacterales bacterium]
PFAPHLADELWRELGNDGFVLKQSWPEVDAALAHDDRIDIPVQVNGKLRSRLSVARGTAREELERLAKQDPKVGSHLEGKTIRKVVVVPDKLVNFVAN